MSYFDHVERDLVKAAAKRARSPRRRFAAFALTGTLVLGVAGTAAGGTYLALRSSSIAPFAASDLTPEQRVAPGTSLVLAPRAADPDPAVPPWAIRVSRSSTGLVCTTVGQVRGDAFGLVGLDGTFRAVPEANADACGAGVLLGTRVFAAEDREDVRTVVNGYAGDGVERVTIATASGKPRPVPVSPEGGFVHVLRGYPEDSAPEVTLHSAAGERRYAFAEGNGHTFVDPDGGPAWRLETTGYDDGEARRPRTRVLCMNVRPARVPRPGHDSGGVVHPTPSPRVCGLGPGRPGVKLTPRFFGVRTVGGRPAVVGKAPGTRTVTVRAGGFSATIEPHQGDFLVFLPPKTASRAVTVTLDGRRYGPTHGTVQPPRYAR